MTTSINTNVSAYFAQNNLRSASASAQSSIARLSSGNKIIRASDDVAALSIGTVLRTDVSTLKTALSNTSQAGSMIQVADGALQRLGEILQRQKALSTQGNADTLSNTERGYLDQEFQALVSEYDRIVTKTNFNGISLLDGGLAANTTSLATEAPATTTGVVAAVRTGETLNTAVITSAAASFVLTNAGTVANNATVNSLQGSLADITVTGAIVTGANVKLTINIGGVNFASDSIDTAGNAAAVTTFTAADNSGVAFTISLADPDDYTGTANAGFTATATDAEANAYATVVQTQLRKLDLSQARTLENTSSTDSSAITSSKFAGTVLSGLDGNDFTITGNAFSAVDGKAPSITGFEITSNTSTNATFSVKIGGVVYSSANTTGNSGGVTVDADISNNDLNGSGASGNGILRLTSADDAGSYLDITLTATASGGVISIASQSDADGLAAALNAAFGSGSTGGAAFQVGTDSDDTISVAISSVKTIDVYKDNDNVTQTLSVGTKAASVIASGVLDNAINTLTAVRAQVGAVQSRFNFAAATLETSVQNLDSARAGFLDADISNESTAFASQQVLIQASISVLAQANQLPQNLLKLIG